MTKVLVINSSATGEASVSRALVRRLVSGLQAQDQAISVVERDLGGEPIPHIDAQTVAGFFGAPGEPAQARLRADALVAELQAADVLVIGAPMYNFGIASTLKAWFDHVVRAGITFRYTETGPQGLLKDKRAFVVSSRGGVYSQGPAVGFDAQEPFLRNLLGFIGITDVTFIRAEGLAMGPDAKAQAVAAAEHDVDRLIESGLAQAA